MLKFLAALRVNQTNLGQATVQNVGRSNMAIKRRDTVWQFCIIVRIFYKAPMSRRCVIGGRIKIIAKRCAKGDFLGFGGVDGVKFRGVVEPGDRLVILGKMIEVRPRRCLGATQGLVNGQMVYEGMITGMWL